MIVQGISTHLTNGLVNT